MEPTQLCIRSHVSKIFLLTDIKVFVNICNVDKSFICRNYSAAFNCVNTLVAWNDKIEASPKRR